GSSQCRGELCRVGAGVSTRSCGARAQKQDATEKPHVIARCWWERTACASISDYSSGVRDHTARSSAALMAERDDRLDETSCRTGVWYAAKKINAVAQTTAIAAPRRSGSVDSVSS